MSAEQHRVWAKETGRLKRESKAWKALAAKWEEMALKWERLASNRQKRIEVLEEELQGWVESMVKQR